MGESHSLAKTPLKAAQAPLAAAIGIHGAQPGPELLLVEDVGRGVGGGESLIS